MAKKKRFNIGDLVVEGNDIHPEYRTGCIGIVIGKQPHNDRSIDYTVLWPCGRTSSADDEFDYIRPLL